jgi:N-acetylglucosamine-6-phosphate deacetylase
VETTLLDDRLTTEVIGDGYHISPSLMKLILKIKGPERLAVVTDASPLMGLPPGAYQVWGIDVILEESIAFVADRSSYAGSVVPMDRCLRQVIAHTGVSLRDALRMLTLTPATILGVANRKGSLEVGKDADIVILDHQLNVAQTIVTGRVVFSAAEG